MWGLTTMKTIWSYTTCEILPSKINNKTEFLLPTKPVPQIWIMSVRWVSLLFWKYLLVKEEQWFCWKKVSKFLRAALIANERQIDVGKISGKKLGNFVTPTTKTDILILLKKEKLLAATIIIQLHDDVILLQLPESLSLLFSYAIQGYCSLILSGIDKFK